ncbi:Low molecular weight protein-tyrosine-phosphatase Wzb [Collimonas arenae]|uniref:protein-tyrosine-phosphatase n=1 Tax=Collimonas arenae TaxID=279058 RepID=A0A0A1FF89_9BURK|nr:low molecular weight protein-tyrosine-phosphatase [Collimonas arenae]AIY43418.1 Low molecular weight protein-tyrosine-phosphatase Wzb [Collimonas arenae]
MIDHILVVCIGNICRSPMAEALLRRDFPQKTIRSAGIGALVGHAADPSAVRIMQQQGIDIQAHRAQSLAGWMISQANLILTMERDQKRHIEMLYASAKGKVLLLGETGKYEIPDPYKEDFASFQRTYQLIAQGVGELSRKIQRTEETNTTRQRVVSNAVAVNSNSI